MRQIIKHSQVTIYFLLRFQVTRSLVSDRDLSYVSCRNCYYGEQRKSTDQPMWNLLQIYCANWTIRTRELIFENLCKILMRNLEALDLWEEISVFDKQKRAA